MPALHVRNVPAHVYEALQLRARRNRRSLNAEALAILGATAAEEADFERTVERLGELAREINLPSDAPRPEELIRELRDATPRGL